MVLSVSLYLHEGQKAIHIATDGRRVCLPMIIVDEKTAIPRLKQEHIEGLVARTITIRDLLRQGVVEYVDSNDGIIIEAMRDVILTPSNKTKKITNGTFIFLVENTGGVM